MESGAIADFQITGSSAHDIGNVGPQHARLVEYFISIFFSPNIIIKFFLLLLGTYIFLNFN